MVRLVALALTAVVLGTSCGGGGGGPTPHYVRFETLGSYDGMAFGVWEVGDDLILLNVGGSAAGELVAWSPGAPRSLLLNVHDVAVDEGGRVIAATTAGLVALDDLDSTPTTLSAEVFEGLAIQDGRIHGLRRTGEASFAWLYSDDDATTWQIAHPDLQPGEFGAQSGGGGFVYDDDDIVVAEISGDGDFGYNWYYVEQQYTWRARDEAPTLETYADFFPVGTSPGGLAVFPIDLSTWVGGEDPIDGPMQNDPTRFEAAFTNGFRPEADVTTFERVHAVGLGRTLGFGGYSPFARLLAVDNEGRLLFHSGAALMRTVASVDQDASGDVLAGPGCKDREHAEFSPGTDENVTITIENGTDADFVVVPFDDQGRYHPLGSYDATGFHPEITAPGATTELPIEHHSWWMALALDETCLAMHEAPNKDRTQRVTR